MYDKLYKQLKKLRKMQERMEHLSFEIDECDRCDDELYGERISLRLDMAKCKLAIESVCEKIVESKHR